MRIEQCQWTVEDGWSPDRPGALGPGAQVVLVFAAVSVLRGDPPLAEIGEAYPDAWVVGCSTAGEICGTRVSDHTLVATAVAFEHTQVRGAELDLRQAADSFQAGERLARALMGEGLVHVLVLSEGIRINGSALVQGLKASLPSSVTVTGGLAGDGERFRETLVFLGGPPAAGRVAALGFYGPRLKVGCGSLGGWDPFGPERLITRSEGNILYELDGKPALALYKAYLGEYARDLPASGLLFPLSLRTPTHKAGLVRTILAVDEDRQSMTFAGDVPEGTYARLMKANFERLIDGATLAARTSCDALGAPTPELALLISCVGRKMVLKQRIEEEVESVREIFGAGTVLTGFYSYGEISPFTPEATCELHNQTMTITTFRES